jgi:predicted Zn-dependent protease
MRIPSNPFPPTITRPAPCQARVVDIRQLEQLLQPAMGCLQPGMLEEANDELEELPPEFRAVDEVLGLRIEIYQRLAKWESARVLAESLAKRSPENPGWWLSWSYALRRELSVEAAQAVLRETSEIHPDVPLIAYILACYAVHHYGWYYCRPTAGQAGSITGIS